MRTTPRQRRPTSPLTIAVLRPLLRYSYSREAYVFRFCGNRHGPVLQRRHD